MGKLHINLDKKRIIGIIVIVLLLAGATAAGFIVRWIQGPSPSAPSYSPAGEKLAPPINDAQNQAVNGNYEASNQTLQQALNQPNINNDEKFALLLQQGVNYTNQNQPQKALDTFKQAEAIKSNYTVSHLMAEQYAVLGDKPNAIAYFKKAISQLDPNTAGYKNNKTEYETKIKDLGGQP